MAKKSKRLFETDKRMELRLRLAMKKAENNESNGSGSIDAHPPARELLDRLILRVERL